MSYARFAEDSDVYVFLSIGGHLECCSCRLKGKGQCASFKTTDEMLSHLREHREAGHDVPERTVSGCSGNATRTTPTWPPRPIRHLTASPSAGPSPF
jgi:hypothetical protein